MSAEEFFAVLEKTPIVDLEIELLSRSIQRTRDNIAAFTAATAKLRQKHERQKLEMVKLLARAHALTHREMASIFEPQETAG